MLPTVMDTMAVSLHPLAAVPVTVYIVLAVAVQVADAVFVELSPAAGVHV